MQVILKQLLLSHVICRQQTAMIKNGVHVFVFARVAKTRKRQGYGRLMFPFSYSTSMRR